MYYVYVYWIILQYSSWSDNIRKLYKGISVKVISQGRGADVVEVLEEFRPKPTQEEPEAPGLEEGPENQ